ncbi:MAG TPA: group 1 truncated hemoglobin, partial [Polyangiaceae bacterium]|nr:group 1 truncated hemoglobin [Polyangiaceae bacterium]
AMVSAVERWAQRVGASPSEIHADPYEVRSAPQSTAPPPISTQLAEGNPERGPASDPDHEIWLALDHGQKLNEILTDFYGVVFEDEILSPYFAGVTKERVIGQVYSFMRDHFTGERKYFGLRPRTGHHWMVISDAIFDHRERLMRAALVRAGLAEPLIERWLRFEEGFREDIVKATPWKLVVNGVEMPLDGFGEEELTSGTLCDGCERAIEVGERVRYHLRLGRTYCRECTFTNRAGESTHVGA